MSTIIALTATVEPVKRDDGTYRLISPDAFDGSVPFGKAKDAHHRILSPVVSAAFDAWLTAASGEDIAAAIAAGSVTLDVTDTAGKRGAPRQSAPSFAALAAERAAAAAAAAAKPVKGDK